MTESSDINGSSNIMEGINIDIPIKKRVVKVIKKLVVKKAVTKLCPVAAEPEPEPVVVVVANRDNSPAGYIASMDDMSKKAMAIARDHLESSFNLEKSNGYLDYVDVK